MSTEKKQWISDKGFFYLVLGITAVIPIAVTILQMLPESLRPGIAFAKSLSKLNAIINSLVSIALILGYSAIRYKKDKSTHQKYMLTAFILSAVFLISYVIYHLSAPPVPYCNEGSIRYLYFFILITHIVLAAIVLPMVLYTIYFSTSGRFDKHKKWARWTFPIWLYVSITGVVVYLMLAPCM